MSHYLSFRSIGLLIQIALPVMLYAPEDAVVTLKGGTNAIMAPQVDFLQNVFKPLALRFGMDFELDLKIR